MYAKFVFPDDNNYFNYNINAFKLNELKLNWLQVTPIVGSTRVGQAGKVVGANRAHNSTQIHVQQVLAPVIRASYRLRLTVALYILNPQV